MYRYYIIIHNNYRYLIAVNKPNCIFVTTYLIFASLVIGYIWYILYKNKFQIIRMSDTDMTDQVRYLW